MKTTHLEVPPEAGTGIHYIACGLWFVDLTHAKSHHSIDSKQITCKNCKKTKVFKKLEELFTDFNDTDRTKDLLNTITQTAKNRLQRVHELEKTLRSIKNKTELAFLDHRDEDHSMVGRRLKSILSLCIPTSFFTSN